MTDAALVAAARGGRKEAFVEIVARFQPLVCAVAYQRTGSLQSGEDVAQETFVTAWRKIGELREPEKLRAWLLRIAGALAVDHLRRDKASRREPLTNEADFAAAGVLPDEAAAAHEEEALVWSTLESLPESYRLPLILHYREGQSAAQVAEALELSEDAVKQRLSRGRDMLRERLSGLVEGVLRRRVPSAVFVLTVAAAIGALTAPAVVAAGAFTAGATVAAASSTAAPVLTAMKASKATLAAAAAIAVVSVPAGYAVRGWQEPPAVSVNAGVAPAKPAPKKPDFSESALYAEWRRLHEEHQPAPQAMPALYAAIAELKDPFRRRAFRSALIAEWAETDPQAAWKFFTGPGGSVEHSYQLMHEWLTLDAQAAVTALLSVTGREESYPEFFKNIARHAPDRLPEVLAKSPKSQAWDTRAEEAFALMAEKDLGFARATAEGITGPWRERALNGVMRAWAEKDGPAAMAWAQSQPEGAARDEWIRQTLTGWAKQDPIAALDRVDQVPPGSNENSSSDTASRVLGIAAGRDFDATLRWLKEHPGKVGSRSLAALGNVVASRFLADPAGFAEFLRSNDTGGVLKSAVQSALLNDAYSCKAPLWEWVNKQPASDPTAKDIREHLLCGAAWREPEQALKWMAELPDSPEFTPLTLSIAESLQNKGTDISHQTEMLAAMPAHLRTALLRSGFALMRPETARDIPHALTQYNALAAGERSLVAGGMASQWAQDDPEAAIAWVATLSADERLKATEGVVGSWATYDSMAASQWITELPPGAERDAAAKALSMSISEAEPESAWRWSVSIQDPAVRAETLPWAYAQWHRRDPAAAAQAFEEANPTAAEREAAQKFIKP